MARLQDPEDAFVERKPQTNYALTERGRKALLDYVAHLESLLPAKKRGR